MLNFTLDLKRRLRAAWNGPIVLGLGTALLTQVGSAQTGMPFAGVSQYEQQAAAPSNPQLISPAIEAKVDSLLRQIHPWEHEAQSREAPESLRWP